MRWLRGLAVLATAAVLASGCTSVPTTGPITRVSAVPGRVNPGVEIAPAPPTRNAAPIEVVEGFLHATASWQPGYGVARQYLTPEASARWQPDRGVRIYAEGNPVVASDTNVLLRAPIVGSLSPDGAYQQSRGQVEHDFGLVKDADGQWRIGHPPDGLLVSEYLFTSAFTRVNAYSFASGRGWLVPDPRFFPRAGAYEAAVRALLRGPTPWLEPVVDRAHPALQLESVQVSADGVAHVALRPPAEPLTPTQRQALVTSTAWTLRQFTTITAVEVGWAGEEPWDVPPYGAQVPVTAFPEADPSARQTSRQLFAVSGGRVVRSVEGTAGGESLVVAPGLPEVALAAIRPDTLGMAGLVPGGGGIALGPVGPGQPRIVERATAAVRPQFDRQGLLWTVAPDGRFAVADADGQPVPVETTLAGGRIVSFRLSPDAVRVALVVERGSGERTFGLARVTRQEGMLVVDGWRELSLAHDAMVRASVVDAGWRTADSLLVLVSDDRTTSVLAVAQDGSSIAPIGPSGVSDLMELAVSPGAPAMVRTRSGEVWRYNSDFRWSQHATGVSSVFYPG